MIVQDASVCMHPCAIGSKRILFASSVGRSPCSMMMLPIMTSTVVRGYEFVFIHAGSLHPHLACYFLCNHFHLVLHYTAGSIIARRIDEGCAFMASIFSVRFSFFLVDLVKCACNTHGPQEVHPHHDGAVDHA